jgi:hypothetical protein
MVCGGGSGGFSSAIFSTSLISLCVRDDSVLLRRVRVVFFATLSVLFSPKLISRRAPRELRQFGKYTPR